MLRGPELGFFFLLQAFAGRLAGSISFLASRSATWRAFCAASSRTWVNPNPHCVTAIDAISSSSLVSLNDLLGL